jgi:hypothetical protein
MVPSTLRFFNWYLRREVTETNMVVEKCGCFVIVNCNEVIHHLFCDSNFCDSKTNLVASISPPTSISNMFGAG